MEFVKLEDVKEMIGSSYGILDLMDRMEKLRVYKAEYKAYMPIRLRDYGYMEDGKPHEFDCGADQNHHWLQIQKDGSLQFTHMQNGSGSESERAAKADGEYCFIPTYEHTDEIYGWEGYITPRRLLVIELEEGGRITYKEAMAVIKIAKEDAIGKGKTLWPKAFDVAIAAMEKAEHEKWHLVNADDPGSFPDSDRMVLVSFSNFPGDYAIGMWKCDDEGGSFYIKDGDLPFSELSMFVNAWRECPEVYEERDNG